MSKQKYTIADVQQEKLMEWGLDIKDAFILSYLRELSQLDTIIKKEIDDKTFIWIDYDALLSYLPVLNISNSEVIGRRFKKYEKAGLLVKHLHKTKVYGTYTFFYLEDKFFDLFEISKIKPSKEDINKQLEKMGLSKKSTQKSGGFDSKVGSLSTQKSVGNTPINILPKKDSSSTDPAAASSDDFEKELKTLISKTSISKLNPNTLKNIKNYSRGDIEQVKRAIKFMQRKNKSMTADILVAILRDKDFDEKEALDPIKLKASDKIDFMIKKLGKAKVKELRDEVLKDIGFDGPPVDNELGNILCRHFNKFIQEGGVYV